MPLRRGGLLVLVIGVVAAQLLAGCSAGSGDPGADAAPVPSAGPWAQEFGDAVSDSSAYETKVLEDGLITSAELADAQARKKACMRDAGYVLRISDDGTSDLTMADGGDLPATGVVDTAMQTCARRFDRSITMLFNELRRNPEKQDEATITVACLRVSGIVDGGYSERKWRSEYDSGVFSFNEWDERAVQCRLDPLGLWRDR